jgi:tRNA A37 N6-isopentenylltransferase MiaA
MDLEAAIELDAARNVAFAKRQRTWLRREPTLQLVDAAGNPERATRDSLDVFVAGLG